MNVVLEYDISEEHQSILVLKKLPGVEHDLNGLWPRKDG